MFPHVSACFHISGGVKRFLQAMDLWPWLSRSACWLLGAVNLKAGLESNAFLCRSLYVWHWARHPHVISMVWCWLWTLLACGTMQWAYTHKYAHVCEYIYIYTYIHRYTYTHTHTYIRTYVDTQPYTPSHFCFAPVSTSISTSPRLVLQPISPSFGICCLPDTAGTIGRGWCLPVTCHQCLVDSIRTTDYIWDAPHKIKTIQHEYIVCPEYMI